MRIPFSPLSVHSLSCARSIPNLPPSTHVPPRIIYSNASHSITMRFSTNPTQAELYTEQVAMLRLKADARHAEMLVIHGTPEDLKNKIIGMRTPILPLESPTDTTQSSTATSVLTSTSQTPISTTLPAPSTNPLAGLPGSSLWVASLT